MGGTGIEAIVAYTSGQSGNVKGRLRGDTELTTCDPCR